jgi:hypothetical protein
MSKRPGAAKRAHLPAFAAHTIPQNAAQIPTATPTSSGSGEKISQNPRPFTSAEKLDTQKGIMNIRTVGQNPIRTRARPDIALFTYSAIPTITQSPNDVSHIRVLGSKYRTSTTRYQKK